MTCSLTRTKRRHGWSLIELLVAITTVTSILMLVASALHHAFRFDRTSRANLHASQTTLNLAGQLRDVAHSARRAELLEAGDPRLDKASSGIIFELADGSSSVFRSTTKEVERLDMTGEKTSRRESFPIGLGRRVQWSIDQSPHGSFAELSLLRHETESHRSSVPALTIIAAVGSHTEAGK